MSDDAAEVDELLFDALRHEAELVQTDGRREELGLYARSAQVAAGRAHLLGDLPREKLTSGPYTLFDMALGNFEDLFGRR